MGGLEVREPLQMLLCEIHACDEAIDWAKGRRATYDDWRDAPQRWRLWLARRLDCRPIYREVYRRLTHGWTSGLPGPEAGDPLSYDTMLGDRADPPDAGLEDPDGSGFGALYPGDGQETVGW